MADNSNIISDCLDFVTNYKYYYMSIGRLQHLIDLRSKKLQDNSDSPLKKSDNIYKLTAQSRRFEQAKQTLSSQISQTDALFQRWSQALSKGSVDFHKHFGLLQNEFKHLYSLDKHRPSLISYTEQIKQLIQNNKIVCINHKRGRSQLFQLIIGLLIQNIIQNNNKRIILYTSKQIQHQYQYFYLNIENNVTNLDKDYRQELLKQISNLQIRYHEQRIIPKSSDSKDIIVFDFYHQKQTLYSPLYNKVFQNKLFNNLIVYTSDDYGLIYDELIEIDTRFPIEIVQQVNMKQTIYKILEESKLYAAKADIVIFANNTEAEKKSIQDFIKNTKFDANVIAGTQEYKTNTNNIFIVANSKELALWRYNYQHVIAVFDYGLISNIYFSIEEKIYVQTQQQINQKEADLRISFLGSLKPGKYFQLYNWRPAEFKPYHKDDLSLYILSMLSLDNSVETILKDKTTQVKNVIDKTIDFLKNLDIVSVNGALCTITDKTIHNYDLSPFFAKMLLGLKVNKSQANILTYLIAALLTPGNLKKSTNKNVHNIWKKQGDLSIYTQILYLYQLELQNTKKGQGNVIVQQQPVATEQEYMMFGNLYNQYQHKPKPPLSKMPLDMLTSQLDLNQIFVSKCLQNVRKIRNAFKLKFMQYQEIDDEIPQVLELLLKCLDNGAVYSGSRRFGYKMKSGPNYLLAKQHILNILNERPNLIIPFKVIKHQNKQSELILVSKIPEQMYLVTVGDIPICSQKSSFSDTEVQFTGVSNAMFQAMWKGSFIQTFQKKHACLVQPNQQIASIIIFCSKQSKPAVTEQFQTFIDSVKTKLQSQVKQNQYYVWQLIFQKGGSIKEILSKNDTRKIKLINIPLETTTEQVRQLLEDYADLDNLVVTQDKNTKTKTALITFATTADLKWAIQQLDCTNYEGKKIKFLEDPKQAQVQQIVSQNFMKIKWYAWPLTKKGAGIIIFKQAEGAIKAAEIFARPFDNKQVVSQVKGRELHLKGLNPITDQTYLRSHLQVYGQIEDVQLQKTQSQQSKNAQGLIQHYVKKQIQKDQRFDILYVNKMSNGLRIAKLKMYNPQSIIKLSNQLNQKTDIIGKTRVYIQPQNIHPILIADHKMQAIYFDILHQSIAELKIDPNSLQIKTLKAGQNLYIVLKSKNSNALTLISNKLNQKLQQQSLDLTPNNKEIYFSEIGKEILNRLEQQYKCKFVYDDINKKLGVICQKSQLEPIIGELYFIPTTIMEDTVVCSMKTYKHLCKNPNKLTEIKSSNSLEDIKIDHIGKSIRIIGLPYHLIQTRKKLLFYLVNIHTEHGESAEACGICCQFLNRPYRLQICGHSFCQQCLMFSINNAFGDASCFPLKCPHCLFQIAIQDLNCLLDAASWAKVTNIAVNDFVSKNGDKFAFCYTPNCRGLHNPREQDFQCKVCLKSYCSLCKADSHPRLTCSEAKDSEQVLLRKYMEQNDVRICPNPGCKMLMQRIDGCYRVTCSTCNQSICFKCPKDAMKIFPTADECYKHLNDEHGGYW